MFWSAPEPVWFGASSVSRHCLPVRNQTLISLHLREVNFALLEEGNAVYLDLIMGERIVEGDTLPDMTFSNTWTVFGTLRPVSPGYAPSGAGRACITVVNQVRPRCHG